MCRYSTRAAARVLCCCVLLVATQSVWADDMRGGAASELIAAINNGDRGFVIQGEVSALHRGPQLHVRRTTGNESVQFAGLQASEPLATLSGNRTFIIEPQQPTGNAVIDFGNQYNVLHVQAGSTLILRRVAAQGMPPNFVNPPPGQPALRNTGLLTWPSIVLEPGSTIGFDGASVLFAANWCGPSQLSSMAEMMRARYNSSDVVLEDGAIYIGLNVTIPLLVIDREGNKTVGNVTMWTAGTRLLCYPTPGITSNGTSTAAPNILNPVQSTNLIRPVPTTEPASSGLSTGTIIALSVCIPLAVLTLLAAAVALWCHVWRRCRWASVAQPPPKSKDSWQGSTKTGSNRTASTATDRCKSPAGHVPVSCPDDVQQRSWALRHQAPKGMVLGKKLGQGSYGQVYRATWQGFPVAVKVVHHDAQRREELQRIEAGDLQRVTSIIHPNVVATYRVWMQGQGMWSSSSSPSIACKGDGCSGIADPAEACLSKRLSSPFASTTPPQTPTPPSSTRVPSPVPLVPIDSDQFSVVSGSTGPADLVGLHAGHRDGNEEPDGCSSSDAASDAAAGAPGRVAVGHVSTKGGQGGPARAAASPTKTEPTTIQTCVMMEWCEMGSLFNAVDAERLPRELPNATDLEVALLCLRDIAAGVAALHESNIIHGDLKTANVLLKASKHSDDPRGYICKVADLGLSRWFGDDNLKTHTITCTLGTMAYQPPEMLHEGRLSKACDIYSLGMIAWELLTGQHPFMGMHAGQVFYHVVVLQQREDIPPGTVPALQTLIEACWAHEPAARPTIGMVLASINAIVRARFGRGEDSTASDVGSDAPAHVVVAVDGQSGL